MVSCISLFILTIRVKCIFLFFTSFGHTLQNSVWITHFDACFTFLGTWDYLLLRENRFIQNQGNKLSLKTNVERSVSFMTERHLSIYIHLYENGKHVSCKYCKLGTTLGFTASILIK